MGSEYKNAYYRGNDYLKNNKFEKAINCFNYASNCINYEDNAIAKIIQIKLKNRDLLNMRKLLEENKDSNNPELKFLYGSLEESENNFFKSKSYYEKCLNEPLLQKKSMLSLARINFQLGNYLIAEKIYESLYCEKNCDTSAIYGLIILNYYLKDYAMVKKLIKKIDKNKASEKTLESINRIANEIINIERNREPYWSSDTNFEHIVEHINTRHCHPTDPLENHFLESIDISELLSSARRKIEPLNGNHYYISDLYKLQYEYPIGYSYGELTNSLCAVTQIGEKGIVTMYPITLSDEFDIEKLSTSKLLKLKRKEGVRKDD